MVTEMSAADPLDRGGMRRHNLGLVLRAVADGTRPSRTDIALATSLHKATVSSLVADLIERDLVREAGVVPDGTVGRPAVALELAGDRYVALGLEINVDQLSFATVDLRGGTRDRGSVRRDVRARSPEQAFGELAALIEEPRRRIRADGSILVGATLALPGLVDPRRGSLLVAPNLGWRDVDVFAGLRAVLGDDLPLRVENEANLAALAERWYGAGRTHRDFVYVSGAIGVGAGIVSDGELHRGETGFGGEFGHVVLEADGPPCACGGRGCVEALAGLEALLRRTARGSAALTSAADVVAAAGRGEPEVLQAIEEVGSSLGVGLASTANLMGSRAIVLGGYFAALYPWLRAPIERELQQRALTFAWSPMEVLRSEIPEGAAVLGGAALALRTILDDPANAPTGRDDATLDVSEDAHALDRSSAAAGGPA
jgi:predicted NBD/HSP70 family sugar kinase